MAKETMNLGEGFSANVVKAKGQPPELKTRHHVIGWGLIAAILGALGYYGVSGPETKPFQERPGLTESLGHKIGGVLSFKQVRSGQTIREWGPYHNTVVNAGETALRDCFIATSCTATQAFKFHGLGTSSAAIAETQTGCQTELTTQYAVDSTRPTGSQTNNGANVYRTVGTNTVDAGVTVEEFCLMSAASAGTMWTRILTGTVVLSSGDSLVTTYDLTIE